MTLAVERTAGWIPRLGRWAARNLAHVYLALALPTMVVLCFLTQPLHSLDEPAHFLRVVQLTRGTVLPVLAPGGDATGSIATAGTRAFAHVYGEDFQDYRHVDRKTSRAELARLYAIADETDPRFVGHSNTTIYFPLAYAVPVAAITVARAVSARPLVWLYAGRLASALVAAAITWAVLRRARRGRFLLFVVALLPITLFQTAALSADSLLIPAVLALAMVVGRLIDREPLSRGDLVTVAVAGALVGLGKIAYLPLVLMMPLVALAARRRVDRTVAVLAGVAVATALVWAAWSEAVRHLVFTVRQDVAPGSIDVTRQLARVAADPALFVHALRATLHWSIVYNYVVSMTGGVIGWHDIRVPHSYIVLAVLAAAFVVDGRGRAAGAPIAGLVATASAVSVVAVFFLLYLQWNPVGAPDIAGVQGRYFLPVLPFVRLVTPSLRLPDRRLGGVALLFAAWGAFSAAETLYFVGVRYW